MVGHIWRKQSMDSVYRSWSTFLLSAGFFTGSLAVSAKIIFIQRKDLSPRRHREGVAI